MQKVVIIGAGPAGLTAAYELLKKQKIEVLILEKDELVGGISKTVSINNNYLIDTGIHRFFSKNDKVNEIWNEILPLQSEPAYDDILLNRNKEFLSDGSNPEKDEKSLLIRDRYTRIYYKNNFFDYPISLKFENIKNLGLVTIFKAGCSYIKAKIIKKPEDSLENFYSNRFGRVLYNIFFEDYTEKVWGVHPSQISADWGIQRVKGISIAEAIKDAFKRIFIKKDNSNTETSLINRFVYPKLGSGQMWETMAEKVKNFGGTIITGANVDRINILNGKIKSIEYEKNGENYVEDLDILISSMPIKELIENMQGDSVPSDIVDISTNLPYRNFMSVGMVVKKLKLKNKTNIKTVGNIIPDNWIYVQDATVKMGRLQVFNNWSPYLFKDKTEIEKNVLISFEYFCSDNDEYWNMNDEDFISLAKEEAVKIGIIDENDVISSKRIKIDKAYPAYFGTYKNIDKVKKYLDSFENLYCIGRNGQHRYNNMDHSMVTGIEASNNIINNVIDKTNVWNVNTEKEYHEIKYN